MSEQSRLKIKKTKKATSVFAKIWDYYASLRASKNKRFLNIPVEINAVSQLFNFELLEDEDGRLWVVNSKLLTLYIDEEFNFDNFNMPAEWVQPAINTLKKLLKLEA